MASLPIEISSASSTSRDGCVSNTKALESFEETAAAVAPSTLFFPSCPDVSPSQNHKQRRRRRIQLHANNSLAPARTMSQSRRYARSPFLWTLLATAILCTNHLCVAQSSNTSDFGTDDTILTDDDDTAPTIGRVNGTNDLETSTTVPTPIPVTSAYTTITGVFLMSFVLQNATYGIAANLTAVQTALFETYLESLTPSFAPPPPLQEGDVLTTCKLLLTTTVEQANGVSTASPSATNDDDDVAVFDNSTRQLLLEQQQSNYYYNNASSYFQADDDDLFFSLVNQSVSYTTARKLQGSDAQAAGQLIFGNNNNMTQESNVVVESQTYEYVFIMTYLSASIDISSYPQLFQAYLLNNTRLLEAQLELEILAQPSLTLNVGSITEVIDDTVAPTFSPAPTVSPEPTIVLPSAAPSSMPSDVSNFTSNGNYLLEFFVQASPPPFPNSTQTDEFCQIMENQTQYIAADNTNESELVETYCMFIDSIVASPTKKKRNFPRQRNRQLGDGSSSSMRPTRDLEPTAPSIFEPNGLRQHTITSRESISRQLQVPIHTFTYDFRMVWTSRTVNVSDYPELFLQHLFGNAELVNEALTTVLDLEPENNVTFNSIGPYELATEMPSEAPSVQPSLFPTEYLSEPPTFHPTETPTMYEPSSQPSEVPSQVPTVPPDDSNASTTVIIIVVVVVAVVASIIMVGMAWYIKSRQKKLEGSASMTSPTAGVTSAAHPSIAGGAYSKGYMTQDSEGNGIGVDIATSQAYDIMRHQPYETVAGLDGAQMVHNNGQHGGLALSPSAGESILSHPSLLSNGPDDDDDDEDGDFQYQDPLERHSKLSPLDDFDRFKDQNLEKMRSSVEGCVVGLDGMMSQALTMALIDSGTAPQDLWDGATSGIEIETNALYEVTDWLKRNPAPLSDDTRNFLQHLVNKMVTSVRQGMIVPDDASRTIHEAAALLNLRLASELPVTSVILTGCPKNVTADDVITAFRGFGAIEDAAVASNERGFGLVRFRSQKAVEKVMIKFRTGEIVVQDVAVQVKVLTPMIYR